MAFLSRLFPAMTRDADRLAAIGKAFRPLRADEVRRAIEARVGVDQFPDVPAIVAWCTPPVAKRDVRAGPVVRVNGLTTDEVAAQRAAAERLRLERDRERAAVEGLDEPTRERLRVVAVSRMPVALRSFYDRRPVLASPPLLHAVAVLAAELTGVDAHDA